MSPQSIDGASEDGRESVDPVPLPPDIQESLQSSLNIQNSIKLPIYSSTPPTLESLNSNLENITLSLREFPICNSINSNKSEEGGESKKRRRRKRNFDKEEKKVSINNSLSSFSNIFSQFSNGIMQVLSYKNNQITQLFTKNRNLQLELQNMKGNILTYVRVKPNLNSSLSNNKSILNIIHSDHEVITLQDEYTRNWKPYEFDKCFDQYTSQATIYDEFESLIPSFLNGYNVTLMAYGQTGSGKSYTMFGSETSLQVNSNESTMVYDKELGLNYRLLDKLYQYLRYYKNPYQLFISMVEIYNEEIYDLLHENGPTKVQLRATDKSVEIKDVTKVEIGKSENIQNIIDIYQKGLLYRSTSITCINDHSSRSHCILTVELLQYLPQGSGILISKLNLVDLAGSERVKRSGASGDRLKEAQNINKSLAALGNVITAINEKQNHIPYRDSKLTLLLRDSLNGNSKTAIIFTVCDNENDYEDSLCTLTFGNRVKRIEFGKCSKVVEIKNQEDTVRKLKKQIESLIQCNAEKLRLQKDEFEKYERKINDGFLKVKKKMEDNEILYKIQVEQLNQKISRLKSQISFLEGSIKSEKVNPVKKKKKNNYSSTLLTKDLFERRYNNLYLSQRKPSCEGGSAFVSKIPRLIKAGKNTTKNN